MVLFPTRSCVTAAKWPRDPGADQSRERGGDRPHRNQHSNPAFGDVLNELINFRLDTRQALVLRVLSRRDAAEYSLYVGHVPFTVLVSRHKKR